MSLTYACIVCHLRFKTPEEYEAHYNKTHHKRLTKRKLLPNPQTSTGIVTTNRDPQVTTR